MRKIYKRLFCLLCAVSLLLAPAQETEAKVKENKENPEQYGGVHCADEPFLFEDGDVVGFIGDSITHVEYTGISYQEFIYNYYMTRYPDWNLEFRNLGTASYMAADAVRLFGGSAHIYDRAMVGINKAVIMFGMNEALHHWSAERYIQSINQLVGLLNKHGVKNENIILVAPTPYDQTRSSNFTEDGELKENTDDLLCEYTGELKLLADELGTHYIDLHTPMLWVTRIVQSRIADDTLTVTDNIHPNAMGNTIAGFFFLYQQGADNEVASVHLDGNGNLGADRASVGHLRKKGDRYVSFRYQAGSLPMAVSYEFHEATQYFDVINAISEEKLVAEGLDPAKKYTVYMNYAPVCTSTGKELAEGINLTDLDVNPRQAAAKRIEVLNQNWQQVSSDYRSVVRLAVKGEATQEDVDAAYREWAVHTQALHNEMYEIARDAAKKTYTVEIVSEGYHVFLGHEVWIWAVAAALLAAALGGAWLLIDRKRREKARNNALK